MLQPDTASPGIIPQKVIAEFTRGTFANCHFPRPGKQEHVKKLWGHDGARKAKGQDVVFDPWEMESG